MIPKQLTIQGLYSYQQKQTIDFNTLTDARLFGIFGQVGSGKSTILEAITFAIYGKTDRLNLTGDNRNYNMMNLKSDTFMIEFIFSAGDSQNLYMATAKSRRNRKNFEDVRKIERGAYKNADDKWEPIPENELEKVIGLSYENFKRTIIIPQGRFQEFLQLGNTDRSRMMKELFNLKKFDLYYQVASLETDNNNRKQHIEGQLKQLGDIQPERLESLKKEAEEKKAEGKKLEIQLVQKRKQETELQQLKTLTEKKQELEKQLQNLIAQKETIHQQEQQLKDYQYCQAHFKGLLESENELIRRKVNLENSIRENQQELKSLEDKINDSQRLLEGMKPEMDKKDVYLHQADDFQKMAEVNDLTSQIKKLHERISQGEEKTKENAATLEKLVREQKNNEKKLTDLKQKLPDFNVLTEVGQWHSTKQNLNLTLDSIKTELVNQKKKKEVLLKDVSKLFTQPPFHGAPDLNSPEEGMEWLNQKTLEAKDQLSGMEASLSDLRVQAKLHEFTSELKEGKPCPLCGSLEHPSILDSENVTEKINQIEVRQKQIQDEIKNYGEFDIKLRSFRDKLEIAGEAMAKTEEKRNELQNSIENHQSRFVWDKYETKAQVDTAIALNKQIQQEIEVTENLRAKIQHDLETAQKNKEKYASLLDNIKGTKISRESEKNTLVKQIKTLQTGDYMDSSTDELNEKSKELHKKITVLINRHEQLTKNISELQQEYGKLNGKIEVSQQTLQEEVQNHKKLLHDIESQLLASPWQHMDEVKKILKLQMNTEEVQRKINDYHQEVSNVEAKRNEVISEIDDRTYDANLYEVLKRELEELSENLTIINQEAGRIANEISRLASNLETIAKLTKEHEEILLREEDLKTLKSLFKANGFVDFVSSVYLQNLCNAANERFQKMTRQRLSLELTDDNNFQVRDFMNGGNVRNIKTLSGGQTFQASLALALALADNIQKMSGSDENFFFLDEGFGSLDKDSLDIVFETLKSLRQENRIVGVISHVDEMQQEISTYLKIENDDEKGSMVHESWKM